MSAFKLVFFSPIKNTSEILNHLFEKYPKHLGRIGQYEHCAFITTGIGQFKPVKGAKPVVGSVGELEHVEENRVEVVIHDEGQNLEIEGAISELKKVHPYEEVAYDVYRLENF